VSGEQSLLSDAEEENTPAQRARVSQSKHCIDRIRASGKAPRACGLTDYPQVDKTYLQVDKGIGGGFVPVVGSLFSNCIGDWSLWFKFRLGITLPRTLRGGPSLQPEALALPQLG
jgi:hypothetical protein